MVILHVTGDDSVLVVRDAREALGQHLLLDNAIAVHAIEVDVERGVSVGPPDRIESGRGRRHRVPDATGNPLGSARSGVVARQGADAQVLAARCRALGGGASGVGAPAHKGVAVALDVDGKRDVGELGGALPNEPVSAGGGAGGENAKARVKGEVECVGLVEQREVRDALARRVHGKREGRVGLHARHANVEGRSEGVADERDVVARVAANARADVYVMGGGGVRSGDGVVVVDDAGKRLGPGLLDVTVALDAVVVDVVADVVGAPDGVERDGAAHLGGVGHLEVSAGEREVLSARGPVASRVRGKSAGVRTIGAACGRRRAVVHRPADEGVAGTVEGFAERKLDEFLSQVVGARMRVGARNPDSLALLEHELVGVGQVPKRERGAAVGVDVPVGGSRDLV